MNKKITELPEASQISNEDVIPIVQNGENKQLEYRQLNWHEYCLYITSTISDNSEITIPCNYKVGNDSLMVIFNGEVLLKATDTLDGHYKEVGITGSISKKIKIHQWGCNAEPGDVFKFLVRGDYNVDAE